MTEPSLPLRFGQWLPDVAVLVAIALAMLWLLHSDSAQTESVLPLSFDGSSEQLKRTAIVPTLDTPIPEGKSAIWCASFQMAWNRYKNDIVQAPIQMKGAEDVAKRLNEARQSEADLPAGSFFATAGPCGEIVQEVRREMARRFPAAPVSDLSEGGVLVAYSYLKAGVRFSHPYFDNPDGLWFSGNTAEPETVKSFGIRRRDRDEGGGTFRNQLNVLFSTLDSSRQDDVEFALDLDRHSRPSQAVVARVRRKATLAETLADVDKKVSGAERRQKVGPADTLSVPNMHWRIKHRFRELEGKPMLNALHHGLDFTQASQTIDFHLDRSGAGVESSAELYVKSETRDYHFDRPFLIYLKKRDAEHPFFVMWVDNAELMVK